ncbi:MAG: hypothetical protein NC911_03290 [Candidatus Omnitrophica bacterium]|nr:hypothetical protein [Candidatus Omnitrophota bacterium]MCM8768693.1 hypothetical protein [Candidatus Omnitrophota bacterium]
MPERFIYGPLAKILSDMDGQRTLAQLLQLAEWETETTFAEKDICSFLFAVNYLTQYGYLKTSYLRGISSKEIIKALRSVGLRKSDLLLIHSSLSAFAILKAGQTQ